MKMQKAAVAVHLRKADGVAGNLLDIKGFSIYDMGSGAVEFVETGIALAYQHCYGSLLLVKDTERYTALFNGRKAGKEKYICLEAGGRYTKISYDGSIEYIDGIEFERIVKDGSSVNKQYIDGFICDYPYERLYDTQMPSYEDLARIDGITGGRKLVVMAGGVRNNGIIRLSSVYAYDTKKADITNLEELHGAQAEFNGVEHFEFYDSRIGKEVYPIHMDEMYYELKGNAVEGRHFSGYMVLCEVYKGKGIAYFLVNKLDGFFNYVRIMTLSEIARRCVYGYSEKDSILNAEMSESKDSIEIYLAIGGTRKYGLSEYGAELNRLEVFKKIEKQYSKESMLGVGHSIKIDCIGNIGYIGGDGDSSIVIPEDADILKGALFADRLKKLKISRGSRIKGSMCTSTCFVDELEIEGGCEIKNGIGRIHTDRLVLHRGVTSDIIKQLLTDKFRNRHYELNEGHMSQNSSDDIDEDARMEIVYADGKIPEAVLENTVNKLMKNTDGLLSRITGMAVESKFILGDRIYMDSRYSTSIKKWRMDKVTVIGGIDGYNSPDRKKADLLFNIDADFKNMLYTEVSSLDALRMSFGSTAEKYTKQAEAVIKERITELEEKYRCREINVIGKAPGSLIVRVVRSEKGAMQYKRYLSDMYITDMERIVILAERCEEDDSMYSSEDYVIVRENSMHFGMEAVYIGYCDGAASDIYNKYIGHKDNHRKEK